MKRTELARVSPRRQAANRKAGLSEYAPSMRRTPMTRTRKVRKDVAEQYRDSTDLAFADYRLWLPERPGDWPPVQRVANDAVEQLMHSLYDFCFVCECKGSYGNPIQSHHIAAGTVGRSDEPTNICMLCRECHENVSLIGLSRVLFGKWKFDRVHLSWLRLAQLARKHLPTPAVAKERT